MTNIAAVLKSEITRIAKKEVRNEIESLRKAVSAQRLELAALKRRTQTLEKEVLRLSKAMPPPEPRIALDPGKPTRYSAKALAAQRARLNLSVEDIATLIGTSGQSIYNWESGTVRPRASHMPAIAALKTLTRTQAAELVQARKT